MKKRIKLILGIGSSLILFTGGALIMTQKTPFDIFLTHDFTGKQEEKDKQIRYYETEIAKKVKQEF
ncbi:MAG: hypothetical protein LBI13_03995, partial [Streptococcaceae bacterium]|nr:hypothetical protein [Streptococcaceae bacterium]